MVFRVAACFLSVMLVCRAVANPQAESAEKETPKPSKVNKAFYLIHSHVYESLEKNDPQSLQANNYQIYRDREKQCDTYWKKAIDELEPDGIYVQLYGGASILNYAKKKLGERRVIAPRAQFDPNKPISDYHDLLANSFQEQLREKGLEMDLDTARWELGGESFEGCVYTYGSGMASSLGLKQAPAINFDMSVPDARFLCKAELLERFEVDEADVYAYVFNGPEGHPIAIFLPGFRPDSDAPERFAGVPLDPTKVTVVNQYGITLYSKLRVHRPGRVIPLKPDREHEGIIATDDSLQLRIGPTWYVLGRYISPVDFLAALHEAKIVTLDATE